MMHELRILVVVVTLFGLGGCASAPITESLTASPPQGLSRSAELTDVPFYAQTQYHCGPAALATALNAADGDVRPAQLSAQVYTPGRKGTLKTEIETGTRRNGHLALPVRGMADAFALVADGRPVLVLQNLGLEIAPRWHYAVLVGYDLKARQVVLRSGVTEREVMSMDTFEHTWRRARFWGVVVVQPNGPVPNDTAMPSWLSEAGGLERAHRKDAALTAYETAARHWPETSAPLVAAANMRIQAGRLTDARTLLENALKRRPEDSVAINNLAHVLMVQGDLEAAERLAREAIALGGAHAETAQETLKQIQSR